MKDKNILLTGVTGVLGKGLVEELLRHTDYRLFLLVREDRLTAVERVRTILAARSLEGYSDRVQVFRGDVTKPDCGLPADTVAGLTTQIDVFLHLAALTALNG